MRKGFQKLITKVLRNLDWNSIYEIHKTFKFGIGEGSETIPGLKRKIFSKKLTKADVRNELKILLQFAINNDVPRLVYGQWMIFWFNQDWDLGLDDGTDSEYNDEDIRMESRIEVIYAPQRMAASINAEPLPEETNEGSEVTVLRCMLEKALGKEDYEIASKIRDILKLSNIEE